MSILNYNNIPCPVLKFEEPDSYLILFKDNQRWIYECSLGYGEIIKDEFNGIHYIINNKYHREKGSACEYSNGTKFWDHNGKKHRLNGPAVEYADGGKEYWIRGKRHTEKEYLSRIEKLKRKKNKK